MSYRERKVNSNGTYSQYVHQTGSDVQQPVDIQSRYQQTIQTHNAVSVGANVSSVNSSWIDTNGFNDLAFTLLNDATTATSIDIQWSNDGTSLHGKDLIASSTGQYKSASVPTKARYAKIQIWNNDTAAHIMSAWAYLKA